MALLPEDPGSTVAYPVLETPRHGFQGTGACRARSLGRATMGWQVVKSYLPIAIEMRERSSADRA
jgi:hypothetical protein